MPPLPRKTSTQKKSTGSLSKSLFIRGLQCRKSLWLHKFNPGLKDGVSSEVESRFATGKKVGDFAQGLFPGGVLVPYDVDGVRVPVEEQLRQTEEAMNTKKKVIYEASFQYDNIFVKVDILRKTTKGWEIYEVKAGSKLEAVYLNDAALQYHVLVGAGIPVSKVLVVYVNTSYVRKGDVDVQQLFIREDVTTAVKARQPNIISELKKQRKALAGKEPPQIDIGPYCENPYDCDFQGHCWSHIPTDSVFDLRERGVDKFKLYNQGIVRQKDIPLEMLNAKQKQQVVSTLKKRNHFDKDKIKEFLATLRYPLYFLDFETFQSAIPLYDGTSPYQQIPFQYSLHWQKRAGGRLYHTEYLAKPGSDPRQDIAKRLLADIPEEACVLAYWKSFEAGRLKELAEHIPGKRKHLQSIVNNMVDLIDPFKARYLYSWKQKGSHSIKAVLPAFVMGMSYDEMEIGNGIAAMDAYHQMCNLADKPKELAIVRKNLLKYCKQDTLAMVKLLEVIEKRAEMQ